MTNEEKKQFILDVHRQYMKKRPYDGDFPIETKKKKEDQLWDAFSKLFLDRIPKKLYKYREFTKYNIENLENDIAWFSKPSDFGDIVDFTLNTDIESEMKEFENNLEVHVKRVAIAIINYWLAPYGQTVDETMVDAVLPLFNENGEVEENDAKSFLSLMLPEYASDKYAKQLTWSTKLSNQDTVKEAIMGFLNVYLDFNKRIRNGTYVFCLAEENNNQAMWETYADNASGFCVEYEIPNNTFLGQRMLMNLLPIYYGEKEPVKFFDILVRGLSTKHQINGISFEDYEKWFLSSYTKDPSYSFQKEWRIAFTEDMGGNKQLFPFVKSIILGEKISEDNKKTLVDLAKRKGFEIYQRKLNASGSKIVVVKL